MCTVRKTKNTCTTPYQLRGFTLLEVLVYFTLTGVMVALLGGIAVHILNGKAQVHAREAVLDNAQFIFEIVAREVTTATGITTPGAGATSSTLSLSVNEPSYSPTVFSVASGTLYVQKGSGSQVALSNGTVVVDHIEFQNVSRADDASVRMVLELSTYNPDARTPYHASSTFQSTFYIYEKE